MDAQSKSAATSRRISSNSKSITTKNKNVSDSVPACSDEDILAATYRFERRSAATAIKIGTQLILMKERVMSGQWKKTLTKIGISIPVASRMMKASRRFNNLGGLPTLISLAKSKERLISLLALDDEELKVLDAGGAVRGVSASSLSSMTGKRLRAALRENVPATQKNIALNAGDRIRSRLAGRTGVVVRTYTDGSAAIAWDEGEPQPEGLAHERMPRCMLEFQDAREIAVKNEPAASLPPSASPILGAEPATKATAPEQYPAVYTLLPGEFKGMPVSLICHEGRVWMIAEEIAAILGDSPEAVAEIEEIISYHFAGQGFPEGSYTKARLASTTLVMRLLDQRAIRYLGVTMDGDSALDLDEWIRVNYIASDEPVTPVPTDSQTPAPTLKEGMAQLKNVNHQIFNVVSLVEAQINGIGTIVAEHDPRSAPYHIDPLIEIAAQLVAPFDGLFDQQERAMNDINHRLFKNPEPDAQLPESVWLDLVTELSAEHDGGLSSEDMWRLSNIVDTLTHYGENSPEVTAAWKIVEAYADRNGAVLYDHLYEGEAPEKMRVAFAWKPGMAPHQRRKAQETAPVH